MRNVIFLCVGLATGSWVTEAIPTVQTMADDATREAVAAVKRAIVEGHRTRDREALDALYADDYTALDARGGVRTKEDLLAALPTDAEMIEGRYELVSVRRWGSVVVASGHGRMLYREPDGSTRVSEYDSVNVFEKRGDRWVYSAAFLP